MLTLYYAPGACSLAPHIMLEELGVPFDAVRIAFAAGEQHTAAFLALNPLGRVPVLRHDDFTLTETPAILSYLGHVFPQAGLLPLENPRALGQCEQMLSFFASTVHVAVAQIWRTARFTEDARAHETLRAGGLTNLRRYFAGIEQRASGAWFVAGRFTVADLYPAIVYRWGLRMGEDMAAYADWTAHTARVVTRPAVLRALGREGLNAAEFLPTRVAA